MELGLTDAQIKEYWTLAFGHPEGYAGVHLSPAAKFVPDTINPYFPMSQKELDKARAGYANYNVEKENPIFLIKGSGFFAGAGSGVLMTDRHLFGRKRGNRTVFELSDIRSVAFSDNTLLINGVSVENVYIDETQALLVDFISRCCGLIVGDFRSAVLRISATSRIKSARLDELLAGELVTDVFNRRSEALDQAKPHLRSDQSVVLTDRQLISYDKDERTLMDIERIAAFKKAEFPNIRVRRKIEHPHTHSHTGHSIAHVLKHASLINIITAAVSAGVDASNYFSPPHGKAVFDIYAEKSELKSFDDFKEIFGRMSRDEATAVAGIFERHGYRVEYSDDSPYSEIIQGRSE